MRPEFSRPVQLAHLPREGRSLRLEADAAERAALTRRFGLLALHALSGELRLAPAPGGLVHVEGLLRAEVEQRCVISLEPVRQRVEEAVAWRLLPEGVEPSDGDADPDDIPSEAGVADLGEALAQQLSLALDPYPRAPGATLPAEASDGGAHGPFAALAKLRPRE
ncbi:MAG: DUF177 domain-containing protein [Roseococcus sp.]|nr:DUF177 domain-containing protein [Roseococcus sp.]